MCLHRLPFQEDYMHFLRTADIRFQWRRRIQRYMSTKLQMSWTKVCMQARGVCQTLQLNRGETAAAVSRSIQQQGQACIPLGAHTHTLCYIHIHKDWLHSQLRQSHLLLTYTLMTPVTSSCSWLIWMNIHEWEIDTNIYSVDASSIRHIFSPVYRILVYSFAGTWTKKPSDTLWWISPVIGLRHPIHPGSSSSQIWFLTLPLHMCTHTNGSSNQITMSAAGATLWCLC